MRTTYKQKLNAAVIDTAIVNAMKASEAAHRAYAHAKEICAKTEAQEMILTKEEMRPYWAAESEAFKSADDTANAAQRAGMEVAAFALHPVLGRDAAAAAIHAFQAAAEWL